MRTIRPPLLPLAVLCSLAAGPLSLETSAAPACPKCSLTVERVFTNRGGDAAIATPMAAIRDSQGRTLLASWEIPGEIAVFDPNGAFIRTIGREGAGPSEFRRIVDMAVRGEFVHVFDARLRRETVLDRAFRTVATKRMPGNVMQALAFDQGLTILNADVRTRDLIAVPLHVVDSAGALVRSFGEDSIGYEMGIPWLGSRAISSAVSSGVWSAYRNQYVLQHWSVDGRLLREIRRVPELFPAYFEATGPAPWTKPQPKLHLIHQDAKGRMWVAVAVGDPDWPEGLRALDRAVPGVTHVIDDMNLYYDTVVDVLAEDGTLIATTVVDQFIHAFLDDGMFLTQEYTDARPSIAVWRVHLNEGG